MSGNNQMDWDKFLNGGSTHYNFSYRRENSNMGPMLPASAPVPMSPAAVPVPEHNKNKSRGGTKKASQKIVLPVYKKQYKSRNRRRTQRRNRTKK
jgi:hypothetical protein